MIADWSVDGFSSNSIESPSEAANLNQASRFDDGVGLEYIADTSPDCDSDDIPFSRKLRPRTRVCTPPETTNTMGGKSLKVAEGENSGSYVENGDDDSKGLDLAKRPGAFISLPEVPELRPFPPKPSVLCPAPQTGEGPYHIVCHEGPDQEIHWGGTWIENGIWCM